MMRRRRAREGAVEVLYQVDLMHDDPEPVLADAIQRLGLAAGAAQYLRRAVSETLVNQSRIDGALVQTLEKWKLARLSCVDRAILRLACCEILLFPDVPSVVSINEAVELAKLYGDDKSPSFVNGVLDAIARRYPKPDAALAIRNPRSA